MRFARLPPWLAWEAFGPGNGCASFDEMQDRIRTIRHRIGYQPPPDPDEIGCALIAEPVFFPEQEVLVGLVVEREETEKGEEAVAVAGRFHLLRRSRASLDC